MRQWSGWDNFRPEKYLLSDQSELGFNPHYWAIAPRWAIWMSLRYKSPSAIPLRVLIISFNVFFLLNFHQDCRHFGPELEPGEADGRVQLLAGRARGPPDDVLAHAFRHRRGRILPGGQSKALPASMSTTACWNIPWLAIILSVFKQLSWSFKEMNSFLKTAKSPDNLDKPRT